MKRLILASLWLVASALGQTFYPPVSVDTNALLKFPTNFFTANSNLLNAAVAAGASEAGLDAKLDATNGVGVSPTFTGGLTVSDGDSILKKVQGTSFERANTGPTNRVAVWGHGNYLTNSATVDETELGYLDGATSGLQGQISAKLATSGGTASGLTTTDILTAEHIVFDYLQRSVLTGTDTVALWDPINGLTNGPISVTELAHLDNLSQNVELTLNSHSSQIEALSAGTSPDFVNADDYGADNTGATDSKSALDAAAAVAVSSKKMLLIPGGTYSTRAWYPPAGLHIQMTKQTKLRAYEYTPGPGGTLSAETNLVVGIVNLYDGTTLDLGGGIIDGRYGEGALTATTKKMASIASYGTTNVIVRNGILEDAWDFSIHMRYCTNALIQGVTTYWGPAFMAFYTSEGIRFSNMRSIRPQFNVANFNQHIVDMQGCRFTVADGWYVEGPLGTDDGNSYVISGFTLGSDYYGIFTHFQGQPVDPDSNINATLMLIDGGIGTKFMDSNIVGWNIGESIPIEVMASRDWIIDGVVAEPARDTTTRIANGGAGVWITESGIWSQDVGTNHWNEGGWQWRSRSGNGSGMIVNSTFRGYYYGVNCGGSYVKFKNSVFSGNRQHGLRFGPLNTYGASEFGFLASQFREVRGCEIENCDIRFNGANGISIGGIDDLLVANSNISNNDQNQQGAGGIVNENLTTKTVTTGSTTNEIVCTGSMTVDAYRGKSLYCVETQEYTRIIRNTATTFYVLPATSVALTSGYTVAVVAGVNGDVWIRDNIIVDDQSQTLTNGFSLNPTQTKYTVIDAQEAGTGSTTGVIVSTTTDMVVNEYVGRLVRVTATGQTAEISANTASTISVGSYIMTALVSGDDFDIIDRPVYNVSCNTSERLHVGQRITLKGVQSGAADMEVFVRHFDWRKPDEFQCEPTGTTYQTPWTLTTGWQTTAGGGVVAGTGTIAYVAVSQPNYSPSATLLLGLTSGNMELELDGHYWIGYDPGTGVEWRRVEKTGDLLGTSTNAFYVNEPQTDRETSFSGKAFTISKFNGVFTPTQSFAVRGLYTAMRTHLIGQNQMGGNSSGLAAISAPDVPWPRLQDSIFPLLPPVGEQFSFQNGSTRTITNFDGAYEGRDVKLYYTSGSVPTLDFTSSGLTGYGSDQALAVGAVVRATYIGGKWRCLIIAP